MDQTPHLAQISSSVQWLPRSSKTLPLKDLTIFLLKDFPSKFSLNDPTIGIILRMTVGAPENNAGIH
jgi:hypothetical protein